MNYIKPYSDAPWSREGDKVVAADGEVVADLAGVRPGDAQLLATARQMFDALGPFAQLAKHRNKIVAMSAQLPASHRPLFLAAFEAAQAAYHDAKQAFQP